MSEQILKLRRDEDPKTYETDEWNENWISMSFKNSLDMDQQYIVDKMHQCFVDCPALKASMMGSYMCYCDLKFVTIVQSDFQIPDKYLPWSFMEIGGSGIVVEYAKFL